jgi:uncharacterized protein
MLRNQTIGETLATNVELCDTFMKRGRGLMFRRELLREQALVFVHGKESKSETTIHMFFVFFPIGVIWLDADRRVVDAKLAKPWRPYYAPSSPAQYFIECDPEVLELVNVGDQLAW